VFCVCVSFCSPEKILKQKEMFYFEEFLKKWEFNKSMEKFVQFLTLKIRKQKMTKTTKIRWVIAHEPLSLFVRAAKDFQDFVNQAQTAEKIDVEVMTLSEYSERYNNGVVVTKHDLLDLMEQGKIEMSQMYTTWLAEKIDQDMLALDMPFIFADHDHATRVLEGEVGEFLLNKITEKSNVRGMAFTYSGGFRNVISSKKVDRLSDLTTKH
jgi:TRAP-type C4-dicarboxylate transport system substrate-binding protein